MKFFPLRTIPLRMKSFFASKSFYWKYRKLILLRIEVIKFEIYLFLLLSCKGEHRFCPKSVTKGLGAFNQCGRVVSMRIKLQVSSVEVVCSIFEAFASFHGYTFIYSLTAHNGFQKNQPIWVFCKKVSLFFLKCSNGSVYAITSQKELALICIKTVATIFSPFI